MLRQTLYLWKQAPFIRLLPPLMAGILLQWYCSPPVLVGWLLLPASIAGLVFFSLRLSFIHYRFYWITGIFVNACMLALGTLIARQSDITH